MRTKACLSAARAILALVILVPVSNAAALEIRDPKSLLAQLDQLSVRVPFSESFHCGDTAKIRIFHKDCKFGCQSGVGCMAICQDSNDEFDRTVADCVDDTVSLIDADGTTNVIAAADYQKFSGNLLRQDLGTLDQFIGLAGYIELDDLQPVQFALPTGKNVDAMELTGKFVTPNGALAFLYDVAKSAPGVAQILFKRIDTQKIFKVRDFARKQ